MSLGDEQSSSGIALNVLPAIDSLGTLIHHEGDCSDGPSFSYHPMDKHDGVGKERFGYGEHLWPLGSVLDWGLQYQ